MTVRTWSTTDDWNGSRKPPASHMDVSATLTDTTMRKAHPWH